VPIKSQKLHPRIGHYLTCSTPGEKYKAYVPALLPFTPTLDLTGVQPLIEKANQALGRLDGQLLHMPDISLLLYFYVRKEALLSSQIEGTQSSFDDLLMYENNQVPGVPERDVEEVSHYVAALQHGMNRLKDGFPLSLRLIKEMHAILLRGGRGARKQHGEFRQSQNWIAGTRPGNAAFVPPPADQLMELLGNLKLYLNDELGKYPTLVKAAISHVQFETIHPFLDGNGRMGRLFITLLLAHEGTLEIAGETTESLQQIITLFEKDKAKIGKLKRAKPTALRVYEHFQRRGMATILQLSEALAISQPTATAAVQHLIDLHIVSESSGKKRDRIFGYDAYLNILRTDTKPL